MLLVLDELLRLDVPVPRAGHAAAARARHLQPLLVRQHPDQLRRLAQKLCIFALFIFLQSSIGRKNYSDLLAIEIILKRDGQSVPSQLLDLVLLFARMLLQHDVLLEEAKVAVLYLFSRQLCDDRPLWNIDRMYILQLCCCLELAHLLIEHVLWIDHGGGRGGHPRVDKVVLDRDEVVVVVVAQHVHLARKLPTSP